MDNNDKILINGRPMDEHRNRHETRPLSSSLFVFAIVILLVSLTVNVLQFRHNMLVESEVEYFEELSGKYNRKIDKLEEEVDEKERVITSLKEIINGLEIKLIDNGIIPYDADPSKGVKVAPNDTAGAGELVVPKSEKGASDKPSNPSKTTSPKYKKDNNKTSSSKQEGTGSKSKDPEPSESKDAPR